MTRMLAFVCALLMTAITVSSACVANSVAPLQFTIEPNRNGDQVQVRFRRADGPDTHSWSSSFRTGELAGLDIAGLREAAMRPIRFTVVRDAGRIDCAGNGGNSMGTGSCSMTPDAAFNDFLAANGISRPSEEQTFGLIAVNARRDLVTALRASNYPTAGIDKLLELSAVNVTPEYIRALAAQGYKPPRLQQLVEFGALDITPDFIGSFARAGYANLEPGDLVHLKALDITPEFIAGFERIGYRNLPVDTLVQLKAMDALPTLSAPCSRETPSPRPTGSSRSARSAATYATANRHNRGST